MRIALLIKPEYLKIPDLGPLIETLIKREHGKRDKLHRGKNRVGGTGGKPKT